MRNNGNIKTSLLRSYLMPSTKVFLDGIDKTRFLQEISINKNIKKEIGEEIGDVYFSKLGFMEVENLVSRASISLGYKELKEAAPDLLSVSNLPVIEQKIDDAGMHIGIQNKKGDLSKNISFTEIKEDIKIHDLISYIFSTFLGGYTLVKKLTDPEDEAFRKIDSIYYQDRNVLEIIRELCILSRGKFYYDSLLDSYIYISYEYMLEKKDGVVNSKVNTTTFLNGEKKYNMCLRGTEYKDNYELANSIEFHYKESLDIDKFSIESEIFGITGSGGGGNTRDITIEMDDGYIIDLDPTTPFEVGTVTDTSGNEVSSPSFSFTLIEKTYKYIKVTVTNNGASPIAALATVKANASIKKLLDNKIIKEDTASIAQHGLYTEIIRSDCAFEDIRAQEIANKLLESKKDEKKKIKVIIIGDPRLEFLDKIHMRDGTNNLQYTGLIESIESSFSPTKGYLMTLVLTDIIPLTFPIETEYSPGIVFINNNPIETTHFNQPLMTGQYEYENEEADSATKVGIINN